MKEDKKAFFRALKLAWEIGYVITIPLVILAIAGRWLDKKLDTSPWIFLGGIVFSIFISSLAVYLKTIKIIKNSLPKK